MTDPSENKERRKYKRFVFSPRDEVYGEFKLPGILEGSAVFKIGDISAGGLRVIVPKKIAADVDEGHFIFLNEMRGRGRLELIARVGLKVRWVLSHPALEHAMIGCEFFDISEENRAQIDDFVESELRREADGSPARF